jgi:hypothetical protein
MLGTWIHVRCPWAFPSIPTGITKVSGEAELMTQARKRNQFMTEMLLARL